MLLRWWMSGCRGRLSPRPSLGSGVGVMARWSYVQFLIAPGPAIDGRGGGHVRWRRRGWYVSVRADHAQRHPPSRLPGHERANGKLQRGPLLPLSLDSTAGDASRARIGFAAHCDDWLRSDPSAARHTLSPQHLRGSRARWAQSRTSPVVSSLCHARIRPPGNVPTMPPSCNRRCCPSGAAPWPLAALAPNVAVIDSRPGHVVGHPSRRQTVLPGCSQTRLVQPGQRWPGSSAACRCKTARADMQRQLGLAARC